MLGGGSLESVDYFGRSYGGPGFDTASSVVREGSKYLVAGNTTSFGAGGNDAWILKTDSKGNLLSQKAYGTTANEYAAEIRKTSDKGLIVLGQRVTSAGDFDVWLLKLDQDRDIEWQYGYGKGGSQIARSIGITRDKGYIITGTDESTSSIFVLKLDSSGQIEWQKLIKHPFDYSNGFSIQQTKDKGYILSGTVDSITSQTSKIVIVKLNTDGDIVWQKLYGPSAYAEAALVREISKGYVLTGSVPNGGSDIWVLTLDKNGEIVWQKLYGRPGSSELAVHVRPRGKNFIIIGKDGANSNFLFRLNPKGKIVWQREFQTGTFGLVSLDRSKDGGYILAGSENSDLRLYKTDKSSRISSNCPYPLTSDFVSTDTTIDPENVALDSTDGDFVSGTTDAISSDTTAAVTEDCQEN